MRTYQEFVSEMTYGRGRGPIGRADRNNSPRYRNLGSPTPEQEKENKSREDKAARDAVEKLRRARRMKEEVEIEEGIGMTVASALGNPPISSKRMKLKQALIINKIESDSKKNKKKKYSGKAVSQKEEYENIDELFITRKSPEERASAKRKKKVETLIRLMQHAKDPSADVAKTKKEG